MLARTLPWVYSAYHNRKFSFDYFPLELRNWIAAVEKFIPADQQTAIIAVYPWKKIVERYQGSIRVESEGLGEESCFRFTLPGTVRTRDSQ